MKKLLLLATTALLTSTANAGNVSIDSDDLTLQLLGRFNFQGGYAKQSKVPNISKNISQNRKNFAFNSNAFTAARVTAEHEDLKYGAQLALATATQSTGTPVYDRSHIFLESNWGKVELGSSFSSSAKMSITALDIARATGGDGTDYSQTYIEGASANNSSPNPIGTPGYPGFFLDNANLDQNSGESSRKVTYYTPEIEGFQLGVSYIPDTGNLGNSTLKSPTDSYNTPTTYVVSSTAANKVVTQTTYSESKPLKDSYTVALSYKGNISEYSSIKLAVSSEFGKPANPGTIDVTTTTPGANGAPATEVKAPTQKYKMADLRTWNIGGVFNLGNYSLAASYGDLGKSMTSSQVLGKKRTTKYYTVGGSYVQGPVGASFVYSKAKQYGNSMDIYTLGTDYKLAPGLLPYAEFAYFNGKASLPAVYQQPKKQKFKGWVFILGTKLAF